MMNKLFAMTTALACGALFGIGLAISGMTDTRIILAFLDITGNWNPALMFVMVGALAVTIPGFHMIRKRGRPLLADALHIPENCRIEARPLIGAAIFGVGWGIYGYCPGPALASLGSLNGEPLLFVLAMTVGMYFKKIAAGD
jgi:uncharacterized membrane protein YedE/YeeE